MLGNKKTLALLPMLAVGCAPAANTSAAPPAATQTPSTAAEAQAVAASAEDILPAGSALIFALDEPLGLNTATSGVGEFTATVVEPVYSTEGEIIVPANAKIEGTVAAYHEERAWRPHLVALELERLTVGDVSHELDAEIVNVELASNLNGTSGTAYSTPNGNGTGYAAPGVIVEDDEEFYRQERRESERTTISLISLGTDENFAIPSGTRMTAELVTQIALSELR